MATDSLRNADRKERILIIGSSGHARVAIDLLDGGGDHEIVGVIDDFRDAGERVGEHCVLGGVQDLHLIAEERSATGCFVAIGDNHVRATVAQRVSALVPQLPFVSLVHPAATVARDAIIGDGSILMAGVVVNVGARIGRSCVLNTACSIDHDSILHDFASLAPGARIAGGVVVGAYSAIGIGASVIHEIRIGDHTVIGAGATVVRDVEDYQVAYGVPAIVVRSRSAGEKYL